MTKKDLTPKQREQELLDQLQALKGYFQDEFANSEFEVMKKNIADDLPIFLNTHISTDQAYAEEQFTRVHNELIGLKPLYESRGRIIQSCEEDQAKLTKKLSDLLDILITNPLTQDESSADENYINLRNFYSNEVVILTKLKKGLRLNHDELAFVANNIIR